MEKSSIILYHASREVVEFPEIRKAKYTKDYLSEGSEIVYDTKQEG